MLIYPTQIDIFLEQTKVDTYAIIMSIENKHAHKYTRTHIHTYIHTHIHTHTPK